MSGIYPAVTVHRLYVGATSSSIKQKKRTFNDENNLVIREEVKTLLKANAIQELKFPNWIANIVLVKKLNNKWPMCTDFTSLNKACLEDFYLLQCLGRLVDGNAGHEFFDFMDAFRGYHQIQMLPTD
ncbi:hypothetical protein LIER_22222 [Lithospermum erythrorhizon]|uniref:Reverse transcriptase n=1 Tax=Lithospermum erythrorhizon TaxID=34254 RepID=A0AAV3QYS5_LITER